MAGSRVDQLLAKAALRASGSTSVSRRPIELWDQAARVCHTWMRDQAP